MKIWRDINDLDFPSIYLELVTIDILRGMHGGKGYLARNFRTVLESIADRFTTRAVYDPVNSANIISNTLNKAERERIQATAKRSAIHDDISDIVW